MDDLQSPSFVACPVNNREILCEGNPFANVDKIVAACDIDAGSF